MRKLIPFFLLMLISFMADAQQLKADSLMQLIKAHNLKDSVKAKLIYEHFAVSLLTNISPKILDSLNDEALAISKKLKEEQLQCVGYSHKGTIYSFSYNRPIDALKYYLQSLKIAENATTDGKWKPVNIIAQIVNIGMIYANAADYEHAKQAYRKAIQYAEGNKGYLAILQKNNASTIYNNMSIATYKLGDYDSAVFYARKAFGYARQEKNGPMGALICNTVALVFKERGLIDSAFYYLDLAMKLNAKANAPQAMCYTLGNMAMLHLLTKSYDLALTEADSSLRISQSLGGMLSNDVEVWKTISDVHEAKGEYRFALSAYKKYLTLTDSIANENKRSEIMLQTAQYDFDKSQLEARNLFEKEQVRKQLVLEKAEKLRVLAEAELVKEQANKTLVIAEKEKSQRLAAMKLQQEKINKQNVILKADKDRELSTLLLQKEKGRKQLYLIVGVSLFFSFMLGFVLYKKQRDYAQERKEQNTRAVMAENEMKVLRLQMNPHFIFNSLNSIGDYIHKNNIPEADSYLTKFAKLMRATLESSEEKEIPLAEELKMLELYMQLEGLRLGNKFSYEIKVSADVDANNTMIPPLILQPFVENSIWHGLANKDGSGKIVIEVTKDNSMLSCIVQDDGVGRSGAGLSSNKKSMGMRITQDRIDMLNRFKNTTASIHIVDLEKGTKAEVKLPLEIQD